jgi:hypothetical protein
MEHFVYTHPQNTLFFYLALQTFSYIGHCDVEIYRLQTIRHTHSHTTRTRARAHTHTHTRTHTHTHTHTHTLTRTQTRTRTHTHIYPIGLL